MGPRLRELAAIRGGVTRRVEGRFPAELEPLAGQLNALIAYGQALVERARTHVGNLAHGLQTPLAGLANEATPRAGPRAAAPPPALPPPRRPADPGRRAAAEPGGRS